MFPRRPHSNRDRCWPSDSHTIHSLPSQYYLQLSLFFEHCTLRFLSLLSCISFECCLSPRYCSLVIEGLFPRLLLLLSCRLVLFSFRGFCDGLRFRFRSGLWRRLL